ALAGAASAEAAGDGDTVVRFLNEAAKDPETRGGALKRLATVALAQKDVNRARNVLRGLGDMSKGTEKAGALALLGRALMASENASHRVEADRTMREAIESAPADLAAVLKEELAAFRERVPAPKPPPLPPKRTS